MMHFADEKWFFQRHFLSLLTEFPMPRSYFFTRSGKNFTPLKSHATPTPTHFKRNTPIKCQEKTSLGKEIRKNFSREGKCISLGLYYSPRFVRDVTAEPRGVRDRPTLGNTFT